MRAVLDLRLTSGSWRSPSMSLGMCRHAETKEMRKPMMNVVQIANIPAWRSCRPTKMAEAGTVILETATSSSSSRVDGPRWRSMMMREEREYTLCVHRSASRRVKT